MNSAGLEHRAAHHPPSSQAVVDAHEQIRDRVAALATWANGIIPECDEKRRALDALDDAMMLLNSAVARTQLGLPGYYRPA